MTTHVGHDDVPLTPQELDERFVRRARLTSRAAADDMLARGRAVTYRENDTPAGHVMRKHPDGRIELVMVDLGPAKVDTKHRSG